LHAVHRRCLFTRLVGDPGRFIVTRYSHFVHGAFRT